MRLELSDDHALLRNTVREFAEQEIAPVAEELDRTKAFPYEIVGRLAELDLMGIPFPEEYGGAGGDTLAYVLVVEQAVAASPPTLALSRQRDRCWCSANSSRGLRTRAGASTLNPLTAP